MVLAQQGEVLGIQKKQWMGLLPLPSSSSSWMVLECRQRRQRMGLLLLPSMVLLPLQNWAQHFQVLGPIRPATERPLALMVLLPLRNWAQHFQLLRIQKKQWMGLLPLPSMVLLRLRKWALDGKVLGPIRLATEKPLASMVLLRMWNWAQHWAQQWMGLLPLPWMVAVHLVKWAA